MELQGKREAGGRKSYVPLSGSYGVHSLVHDGHAHEHDAVDVRRHAILGLLDIRAQVEDLGDAQTLEDCLTLGADVGDLSGAEEKAGLDGGGWGSRVGIAEVAQVEDAGDRDEGGLGEGFSDEGGVENSAWREERLVGDGG